MKFTKKEAFPIILIILLFATGAILYSKLPDIIPSHWNALGQIDDWNSKSLAVFVMPIFILIIYLLMILMPKIDPLRQNYDSFEMPYFYMRLTIVFFFVLLNFFVFIAAFNNNLGINYFMTAIFSLMFIVIGLILPKIKQNYFVGIRTPWTIHSEKVWDKTHSFGGKMFIAAGIISLFGLLSPNYAFALFLSVAVASAIITFIYSYLIFSGNR